MPTYQYACTEPSCANRFELVQSFTDPAVTECPVCAGRVRKVYGSVGVVFKGSGFYRTDSRESASNAVKAKSDSAKSESGTSDTKSEGTKSESKKSETASSKSEGSSSKPASSSPAAAAS